MKIREAIDKLTALPPNEQAEVLDFVDFLSARRRPALVSYRRRDLRDEPFLGMWANRPDMVDSAAWLRATREREWP